MVISSTINCLYHAKPENALQNEIMGKIVRLSAQK
jgi:hypothetical protein